MSTSTTSFLPSHRPAPDIGSFCAFAPGYRRSGYGHTCFGKFDRARLTARALKFFRLGYYAQLDTNQKIQALRCTFSPTTEPSLDLKRICTKHLEEWTQNVAQARAHGLPASLVRRLEACRCAWIDMLEDLEVGADEECRTLFDELAAEFSKKQ